MIRYFTENLPDTRALLVRTLSRFLDGFTLIDARGYWRGRPEPSLIIEVDDATFPPTLSPRSLADIIRRIGRQESVLMQTIDNATEFVTDTPAPDRYPTRG